LINYFKNIAIFNLYLFTRRLKEDDEYKIPQNIKRILVNKNLINKIKKNKIQILIYQLSLHKEIKQLNNFNNVKVIFYQHLGIFDWIYGNYNIFKSIYRDYRYSKYVVNIIPFENDYLFKKWGISSIYMNNFMTYNYFNILQSDLSTKRILMIGRGDAKKKRFEIGIEAMEYIKEAIPQSEMIIISDLKGILHHEILINNLNLFDIIKFIGYLSSPEIYYKNSSLNLFPSISEAFPLVMCETKIYGIPNILLGLDYTSISEGGTIIIYDETPESFAKTAIYVLKNNTLKHKLGQKAKKSMKHFNNDLLLIKWVKLILSIYNGDYFYNSLREKDKVLSKEKIASIINKQINLLKKRIPIFKNININDFTNFSFMEKKIYN
jgi:glycosyltransferase involved in cell wall biosynthesis